MDIKKLIEGMTLEEKASLCSGLNHWDTKPVESVGIPSVVMSDGPHGLRRQDGYRDQDSTITTRKAICFPTEVTLAASFDRELLHEVGALLGDECQANDVQMLLGPGVNIKRSPTCGRNFEYLSEDPYLAGELAAQYIQGLQEKGVSACVKHYAANNREFRRMTNDSVLDERTLREIYLPAFEAAVKEGGAKSVMCSYNRINGTYACEHKQLLTDILRDEWGFDGMVVTDWNAMNDRVEALKAGLNLEMPSSHGRTDKLIVEAVRNGKLDETVLDKALEELIGWVFWCHENIRGGFVSMEEHHAKTREIENRCAVLLKNDSDLLPLTPDKRIAFIGQCAEEPSILGGGSSSINTRKIDSALEFVKDVAEVEYVPMFSPAGSLGHEEWKAGVEAAKHADVAVVFVGVPELYETECADRQSMRLPEHENEAIEAIAAANPNTVVILHHGSPIEMPWIDKVRSILEMYMGGEAVGASTIDLLFGKENPSGRLAETFPLRVEDAPAYPTFGKNDLTEYYGEGVFVGYRHYDIRKMDVLFPFGHGLSYTAFEFSNLRLSASSIKSGECISVSVDVTNTGARFGRETVQVYVGFDGKDTIGRAPRELRGFEKVALEPGETKTVEVTLGTRAFAYYETKVHDWYIEGGQYTIYVGHSSRELPLAQSITIESDPLPLAEYGLIVLGDLLERATSEKLKNLIVRASGRKAESLAGGIARGRGQDFLMQVIANTPLHTAELRGILSKADFLKLIDDVMAEAKEGIKH